MPKPFLDHCQRFIVIAAFGIEQPVRRKAGLSECRSEQVAPLDYPQYHSFQPGSDSGCKQARCGIIAERARRRRNLVQRRNRKSAAKLPVHRLHPEWQPLGCPRQARCLNGSDLRSKHLQRMNRMVLHNDSNDSFVHFMFPS